MDEQCDKCGGEGCIVRPKNASVEGASDAEKIERVERLIEQAESLEDLERLEAALRSGNVDAVLRGGRAAGLRAAVIMYGCACAASRVSRRPMRAAARRPWGEPVGWAPV